MRLFLLLFCGLLLLPLGRAQRLSDFEYYDLTYVDNIRSVRLHIDGFPASYPYIVLNSGAQLRLSFDDQSNDVRRYTYRLIHCDRDWQPSNLGPLEYIDGFEEDVIDGFNFSFRTLSNYVHYDLLLPNNNMRITKSGNYLLVITDEENEDVTAITRRFMVVDTQTGISGIVTRPTQVDKIRTHQEIDFSVSTEQLNLKAPLQEVSAAVLQNGRWDNAITNLPPNFIRSATLEFDYQGRVMFQGGNEFRNLDLRSIQAPVTEVLAVEQYEDRYGIALGKDLTRNQAAYLFYPDLNGDYVNLRYDRPVINLGDAALQAAYSRLSLEYTGDYIDVLFNFASGGPFDGQDVYLFGSFTEWQLKPEFRMVYNPATSSYVGKAFIKQGFYNYYYVTAPYSAKKARILRKPGRTSTFPRPRATSTIPKTTTSSSSITAPSAPATTS